MSEPETGAGVVVGIDVLRKHCKTLLTTAGLGSTAADLVADSLVDAEARNIPSHGIQRTRIYVERLRAGLIDAAATPKIVKETAASIVVDANNAIGHVGAMAGIDLAMERAASASVCVAGVRNSNHCGTLAYFARRATAAGMIVIAASNAPPTMVLHGGRSRAVGTNPLAIGVPNPSGTPVVVDMATSATARGKIILASQLGRDVPYGWAVDEQGRPTTDAERALRGSVLPFAGPKGSGLAMTIDLLCGALISGVTGSDIGDMYDDWTRPQRVSHLFIVMDPDAFLGRDEFAEQVDTFVKRVHTLPPADGVDRLYVPGEVEEAALHRARQYGITVPTAVVADLDDLAISLGVPTRWRETDDATVE